MQDRVQRDTLISPELDLAGVQPEARAVVEQAAHVYMRHSEPWFIGLAVHGSAMKGGFIPGCSDIDVKLYLREDIFAGPGHLRLELSIALHRELATIDPAPFSYIQCDAVPAGKPKAGEIGPVPGAYHIVAGRLPVPEATEQEIVESACRALAALDPVPRRLFGRCSTVERGVWRGTFACSAPKCGPRFSSSWCCASLTPCACGS
jgi:hypothetical protein